METTKSNGDVFLQEHLRLSRRDFMQAGMTAAAVLSVTSHSVCSGQDATVTPKSTVEPGKAGARPDPYLTPAGEFRDVSRGTPLPHSLPDEKKQAVGMTRETWSLDVISDPDNPAKIDQPFSAANGTALKFDGLLKLAETNSVRFLKVMSCLNLGCPLGMGLWEGVPLRDVIWLTKPRESIRRIFYYGYHNDDPKQIFRSSLPIGRVLEDPPGIPPVILCYKLNGEWLDSKRGGPVRLVVPEAYGFKSIKWLSHVVLTNLSHANDTYAEQNNDVDSSMKTFAATLVIPRVVKSGEAIAVSGYAQVGVSGLSKVQVSISSSDAEPAEDDPWMTKLPWVDAEMLPAPDTWHGLHEGRMHANTFGFDAAGVPQSWPMLLTNAHWAIVLPGVPAGEYTLRCRTIDRNGVAQPLPRPFRKSGHAAIEAVGISVEDQTAGTGNKLTSLISFCV